MKEAYIKPSMICFFSMHHTYAWINTGPICEECTWEKEEDKGIFIKELLNRVTNTEERKPKKQEEYCGMTLSGELTTITPGKEYWKEKTPNGHIQLYWIIIIGLLATLILTIWWVSR